MVSLSQMTIAGIAGYAVAIFGVSTTPEGVVLGWPWWLAVPIAIAVATLAATLIGWLSVRTDGIYTIMITLAVGVAFYYLVLQNYSVLAGFQGFQKVAPPVLFGHRLALARAVLLPRALLGARRLLRREVRRARALRPGAAGHPRQRAAHGSARLRRDRCTASRPTPLAGALAAVGGVLLVWYHGLITPASIGTNTSSTSSSSR